MAPNVCWKQDRPCPNMIRVSTFWGQQSGVTVRRAQTNTVKVADTGHSDFYLLFLSLPLHRPTGTSHHLSKGLFCWFSEFIGGFKNYFAKLLWIKLLRTSEWDYWPVTSRAVNKASRNFHSAQGIPLIGAIFGHCEIFAKVCWQL